MVQTAEKFNFIVDVILFTHSPQYHHFRPVTTNYKVYVWVPTNNLWDDHHQKVDAFSKSKTAYANYVHCVDGRAQARIRGELRGVDRVRYHVNFLWWNARAKC